MQSRRLPLRVPVTTIVGALIAVLMIGAAGLMAFAQAQGPEPYYTCVDNGSGQMRPVAADERCLPGEEKLVWTGTAADGSAVPDATTAAAAVQIPKWLTYILICHPQLR